MPSKKRTRNRPPRPPRAAKAPAPKHVTLQAGQRLHVHVASKSGKAVSEYIAGANQDGVVTMAVAPEADAPVQTPDSNSGS